ncbi:MAG: hypothetical protein ACTSXX_07570 [Candidatus Baldrarchaeia archaeon]
MKIVKIMEEEDLHDFFFQHPYILIGSETPILEKSHERRISPSSIADLYLKTPTSEYIIEIKDNKIRTADILQALRYKMELLKENLKILIIGYGISADALALARKQKIQVKIIGKDIPSVLAICDHCRRSYDANKNSCPYCGHSRKILIVDLRKISK